jgi:RsiW-degrading membrane proteinase PrsW (M82 family)
MEQIWLYAAIGGFAPTVFWLFFWMRQDIHEPEPRKLILKTFIFGAISAFLTIALLKIISQIEMTGVTQLWTFSFVEESMKLAAVFLAALGSVWNNEREDPMIYMITGALGFSAVENMYYTIDYLNNLRYLETLIDGGYRFIGASLLHVVTSASIGFCISWVFFKSAKTRVSMAFFGLIIATAIHTLFNFLVSHSLPWYQQLGFYGAWAMVVVFLILFEVVEREERYRIIKDGIIYSSKKKVSYGKVTPRVEDDNTLENGDIRALTSGYQKYKTEKFRKKFF